MDPSDSLSSSANFPVSSVIWLPCSAAFASGRGGSLQLLGLSLSSCCCFNPASVNCRVSQFATFHAAFASTEASSANWGFRLSRPNLHLLSLRPDDLLTILEDGFVDRFRKFGFSPLRYPSYKVLTFTLVGLSPTEQTSFSWTHFRTAGFPQYGSKAGMSDRAFPIERKVFTATGLPPSCVLSAAIGTPLLCVRDDVLVSTSVRAAKPLYPRGPSLRTGLFCPGPSSLNRPHPPHSQAHPHFTVSRLIEDAFAVHIRIC